MDTIGNKTDGTTTNVLPLLSAENNTSAVTLRPNRRFAPYPALLALIFASPTTANVRLNLPESSANQTYARSLPFYRRRDEEIGIEAYSPYFTSDGGEVGPLKVTVSRMLTANIRFVGKIRMLPLAGEF
jgi:hypothetical protein